MKIKELEYYLQSSNINYLYGSGISCPYLATLGVIEKWLTDVASKPSLSDQVKKIIIASILAEYSKTVIIPNYIFTNSDSYRKTISEYYRFFLVINDLLSKRRSVLLPKQVNLFTTNIDLLVEKALESSDIELNDGFRGTISQIFSETNFQKSVSKTSIQYNRSFEIPVFNLIKMHGSVNWYLNYNNRIINDAYRLYYLSESLNKVQNGPLLNIHDGNNFKVLSDLMEEARMRENEMSSEEIEDIDAFLREYNKIVMINPTKEKFKTSVFDYHFYELMRLFSNSLEKENSILFVMGFSFADEHIAEITKRAANVNPTLQIIVFAFSDDEKSSLEKNLSIEQGCLNNNINILTPKAFKETNNEEQYSELCNKIENFDLHTINSVFETINQGIHVG